MISEIDKARITAHMHHDGRLLAAQYKTRKNRFDSVSVLHNEQATYENLGYSKMRASARKLTMAREKDTGRWFEDRVWCLFYELGFRCLNADDNLSVRWGDNDCDTQQLDIVAVNNDAIFVVECKAAAQPACRSFKAELNAMARYMPGVEKALREVYGEEKRVKFVFATENYRIQEEGEDMQRLHAMGVYHLNESALTYIHSLAKAYKGASSYQFMGLMFKGERINESDICIPALKGTMGSQEYFIFSIKPAVLLKIGFVLHRTKVNDSMAPTYQRLLVPSRLKDITKFIDDGGYFPNSIVINFSVPADDLRVRFEPVASAEGPSAPWGLLHIPNAYALAYIIDGQHRVYGYASSDKRLTETIPVLAFNDMPSDEQLHIFMDINEKQKAVSPSLRLDLEEDLYWEAPQLNSRMKALRSSIIKMLAANPNNVLYNRISVGEDSAELTFKPFATALMKSGLVPKATKTQWTGDTDTTLYNVNETDLGRAMREARQRIVRYIDGVYNTLEKHLDERSQRDFLFSNRATYAVVVLAGSLHAHLCRKEGFTVATPVADQLNAAEPYLSTLARSLNELAGADRNAIRGRLGQGADVFYLHTYQYMVRKAFPDYVPDGLAEWMETQDKGLQEDGQLTKEQIRDTVQRLLFRQLERVYGNGWERRLNAIRFRCLNRAAEKNKDDKTFDAEAVWTEYLEVDDLREAVDNNFVYPEFSTVFGIDLDDTGKKSKKELLAWFKLITPHTGKHQPMLTKSDVARLHNILATLRSHLPH